MTMTSFIKKALAALFLIFLSVPAMAQEIVVRHVQGEITLPQTPQKVLVFDLAAIDTLDALGVEITGVPGSNLPDYLAKYRDDSYAKVGTLFEPDYEAVYAAQPDLIIIGGRSAPRYAELSKIAPTIDLSIAPDAFLEGAKHNTALLGEIFGKQAEAKAKLDDLDAAITGLRAKTSSAGNALIIMTNGGRVTAYGIGSRFGWIHQDLGFTPAVEDVAAATHGDAVSFEFLLEVNPDWLFVIDRDAAIGRAGDAAQQTLNNELVNSTTAAKNEQILYVDTARWYLVGGGISALRSIVQELENALSNKG